MDDQASIIIQPKQQNLCHRYHDKGCSDFIDYLKLPNSHNAIC
ncbi:hypothetical protein MCRH_1242 [Moraxella catarrhalis RH4]|nr:hypothetical protein MCRH_1242 [Moraxella catarrhalis RH4]